mgnify:CR=1 FL=1
MKMGSGPECESMCHNILRIDPANDEATLMLADFLHRKSDQDGAINLFRDILEARSNNYVALVSFCRGKSFVVVVRLRFEAPVDFLTMWMLSRASISCRSTWCVWLDVWDSLMSALGTSAWLHAVAPVPNQILASSLPRACTTSKSLPPYFLTLVFQPPIRVLCASWNCFFSFCVCVCVCV